jgi:hypothetical protein
MLAMGRNNRWHRLMVIGVALLFPPTSLQAAWLKIHYGPESVCPSPTPVPPGAVGPTDMRWYSALKPPRGEVPQPNQTVKFTHTYTGQVVAVPLALPPFWTPVILHARNRIIYNYGSYSVHIRFLPDGSVDVIYSSGLLRAL